ncbi:glycosyl hydrolase [Clostridium tertium]
MIKFNKRIICIILIVVLILGLGYIFIYKYFKSLDIQEVYSEEVITEEEEILYDFITKKLMNEDGGIYTNFNNVKTEGDLTKGHDVLSESQGMMLNYHLYNNDKESYEEVFKYIKENMLLENNLLSWRIEEGSPSEVSATIDDLRIARSLLIAGEEFNSYKYRYYGLKISKGIKKNLVTDGRLNDFHDGYGKSNITTLCYLDLYGINLLSRLDNSWSEIYNKSLEIINNGYISDTLPLYKKFYDGNVESYDNEENVDTLLSILVILNKAEVNEDVSKSVSWLKNRLKEYGYISTSYNINTLEESKIESTSIYANLAQVAKVINDNELYELCINKMKVFQVKNLDSMIYGAYGDYSTNEVYSYDNLNALLAFRRKFNN